MSYESERDEAADAYGEEDLKNNPNGYSISRHCNDWVTPAAFEAGADWSRDYWLKRTEVLVEALECCEAALAVHVTERRGYDPNAFGLKEAKEALCRWAEVTGER